MHSKRTSEINKSKTDKLGAIGRSDWGNRTKALVQLGCAISNN